MPASTRIVLLRGVMPVGKNKVPMADLRAVLEKAGFKNVRTYIASGNALLDSRMTEAQLASRIHKLIKKHIGPDLRVMVRTGKELEEALKHNPFPEGKPNQVLVSFFAEGLPRDFMDGVSTTGKERVAVKGREVYIHYPDGAGPSKLKLPKIANEGTARNINTITKLVSLSKNVGN